MKACAETPKPIPPQIKAAKARLEKSHKAAKEFEAELKEVIEEAREEGPRQVAVSVDPLARSRETRR